MLRLASILLGLLSLSIAVPFSAATAQFVWPRRVDSTSITLEYLAPIVTNEGPGVRVSSSVFSLAARVRFDEESFFVIDVPYASTSAQYSPPSGNSSTSMSAIGNIYVGIASDESAVVRGMSLEYGGRLPTLAEGKGPATWLGLVGDFNRREAYIANLLTLQGALNYRRVSDQGLAFLFRMGVSFWIPTKLDTTFDSKLKQYLDYGVGVGYEDETVWVGAGIYGRRILKEIKILYENKRAFHHFELGVNGKIGPVRPGVFYRVPIESGLRKYVSHTLGFYASVIL